MSKLRDSISNRLTESNKAQVIEKIVKALEDRYKDSGESVTVKYDKFTNSVDVLSGDKIQKQVYPNRKRVPTVRTKYVEYNPNVDKLEKGERLYRRVKVPSTEYKYDPDLDKARIKTISDVRYERESVKISEDTNQGDREYTLHTKFGDFKLNTSHVYDRTKVDGPSLETIPLLPRYYVSPDYPRDKKVVAAFDLSRFPTLRALVTLDETYRSVYGSRDNKDDWTDFKNNPEYSDIIQGVCTALKISVNDLRAPWTNWTQENPGFPEMFKYVPVLSANKRMYPLVQSEEELSNWYNTIPSDSKGRVSHMISLIDCQVKRLLDSGYNSLYLIQDRSGTNLAVYTDTNNDRFIGIGPYDIKQTMRYNESRGNINMSKLRESITKTLNESSTFTKMSDSELSAYDGLGAMTDGSPAVFADVGSGYELIVAGYPDEGINMVLLASNSSEYSLIIDQPELAKSLGQFILDQVSHGIDPVDLASTLNFERSL